MIDRVDLHLRRARRSLSRSEWSIHLLRLAPSVDTAAEPGLVLIQIDGLSRLQLEAALDAGKMPFLRRLLQREHYQLRPMFSGVPSTTPAVQGELFYGVLRAVPSFSFMDRPQRRIVRMFESEPVAELERRLADQGPALLEGGSAYADVYTGGARESRFCMSSLGWGDLFRTARPWALPVLALGNLYGWARVAALLAIELGLSIVDFIRGVVKGENLGKELKFIPTRVAICILLRELVTVGAKIDVARGLPVVHLNLLGYDEQAHRRGPSSAFAHWALKGIDDAIKRLWRAARRSSRRDYDIWIYSDHGQEATVPFAVATGRPIEVAVGDVFKELFPSPPTAQAPPHGVQVERARMLGERLMMKFLPGAAAMGVWAGKDEVVVTAMGPLGHVYLPRPLTLEERQTFAARLVQDARVPLALAAAGPGRVHAWTQQGQFRLPEDAPSVLGADHPYLEETARDLVATCHHANAGDIVISGWRRGDRPLSFPYENGAHAGPGPEETDAFVVCPRDTPLPSPTHGSLRPLDLRQAALAFLGRAEVAPSIQILVPRHRGTDVRVMTYNVHSCVGMDGKLSPERIARVIAQFGPDVVALQELDVRRVRTGGVDQAEAIAGLLKMKYHFHPTLHLEEEQYGDAVLSPLAVRLVRAAALPALERRLPLEPRGALWISLQVGDVTLNLFNTHLSLLPAERRLQADALLGPHWLGSPRRTGPRILCGDFNALPASAVCRKFSRHLTDAQIGLNGHQPRSTWFGRLPFGRIDHVFVERNLVVARVEVPNTELTRSASDHLPLIVDLRLTEEAADQTLGA